MRSPKFIFSILVAISAVAAPNLAPLNAAPQQSDNQGSIETASGTRKYQEFRDYVILEDGRKIWVEAEILDPSRPTKMIYNGLTNSATMSFRALSDAFRRKGYNVIRFDFPGQAKTLLADQNLKGDYGYMAQVKTVVSLVPRLLKKFNLKGDLDALGQSYGGGILAAVAAFEPAFVDKYFHSLTAFAPYTEPMREQDESIHREMDLWKKLNPGVPFDDAKLYDMIFYRTVVSTYWYIEPEINGHTPLETALFLDGVYELAKGLRPFTATNWLQNLPNLPINVVMADNDQYIPGDVIPKYWNLLPKKHRGYFANMMGVEHKMLQVAPLASADLEDLMANPVFNQLPAGASFELYLSTYRINYGSERFKLNELISPVDKGTFNFRTQASLARSQAKSTFTKLTCNQLFSGAQN
jgi:pimeloyl-ACP methyl ester carboxylesterase